MKLMGIDYGAKRVGIASTDDSGEFAIPRAVLPNDGKLLETILDAVQKYGVEKIIIGESRNLKGEPNPIFDEADMFAQALRKHGKTVEFHPEVYSSMEADQLQGKTPMRDASAAAIILKSYIDSLNN